MSATSEALARLELDVRRALETGDDKSLNILGYGEISTVLSCDGSACKRLPPFPDRASFDAYQAPFEEYLDTLRNRGCAVIDTRLEVTPNADETLTVWCVQPLCAGDSLLPAVITRAEDPMPILERLVATVVDTVRDGVGLDAQISNWTYDDDTGELGFIDVTTPMLRDRRGRERLDTDVFLASLPWALRGVVKRTLLGAILDKYYEPRGVLLDIAGNLHKEDLSHRVPMFLAAANARIEVPIEEPEVMSYYREDARTWALLQRLRRMDRWWQRSVRRRIYPFLLPGAIQRNV